MHTLRLEVEDTIIDKVMLFLQKLPTNEVRIKEEIHEENQIDFIEYLTQNPVSLGDNKEFLSRVEANAR